MLVVPSGVTFLKQALVSQSSLPHYTVFLPNKPVMFKFGSQGLLPREPELGQEQQKAGLGQAGEKAESALGRGTQSQGYCSPPQRRKVFPSCLSKSVTSFFKLPTPPTL